MKDTNHSKELNFSFIKDCTPLVKVKGSLSPLNKTKFNTQHNPLNNQTSFIINLQNDLLSNQLNLCSSLGYSKEPKTLLELKSMCMTSHLQHVEHICKTYINFCKKYLLLQDGSSLSLTFKVRKSNGSLINILCQINVFESDGNQPTKLLVKCTDINFISFDCDLAWALQSHMTNKLKFKKLVAVKYMTTFSSRELEIIRELCAGFNNTQIGKKLFISNHTVATHRKNIFKKSKCHSTSSLYHYCRQRGLD